MPCESCAVQFSVFRRKRACSECERYYCSGCLRRGGGIMCAACRMLSTRPLSRHTIIHLKVRDLQCFLHRQNVSTRGCVEKEELVNLCVSHVNSAAYRRHGPRAAGAGPFAATFKDFTKLINNAFDIRPQAQPAPPPPPQRPADSNCYNSGHTHARERFTTTPGGERDIVVPVPPPPPRSASTDSDARVDTADCFEIEDLDDSGWEFVNRPADPLPNDSAVLIAENDDPTSRVEESPTRGGASVTGAEPIHTSRVEAEPSPSSGVEAEPIPSSRTDGRGAGLLGVRLAATPQRAASDLELRRQRAPAPDASSLQDEPLMDGPTATTTEREGEGSRAEAGGEAEAVSLEGIGSEGALAALSVRQLKRLLARNRVALGGCLERADLLERARTLWRDHNAYTQELDKLPLEECCKICMAAPLECVLLECGHIAACTECSRRLSECPICRRYVVRAVRCFRS